MRPRQIYYAARKEIESLSGQTLGSDYFSQDLLIAFIREHPDLTKDWDICWDDRGHFEEPHNGIRIGVGTASVRDYLASRSRDLYGAILYVEKEGFDETFKAYQLQERYDLALMSSKGMGTTAARQLIEALSGQNVKILCLHDFDISGMTILSISSRDTDRYKFERKPEVIDIGLRLSDVLEMGLESEAVETKSDPTDRLLRDGATEEEIVFLRSTLGWNAKSGKRRFQGQRVELNSMTNPQLIEFVERKLEEHGVAKVIPYEGALRGLYHSILLAGKAKDRMEAMRAAVYAEVEAEMESFEIPEGLHGMVEDEFTRNAGQSWQGAIRSLVDQNELTYRKQK